jgi:hypothetical protein
LVSLAIRASYSHRTPREGADQVVQLKQRGTQQRKKATQKSTNKGNGLFFSSSHPLRVAKAEGKPLQLVVPTAEDFPQGSPKACGQWRVWVRVHRCVVPSLHFSVSAALVDVLVQVNGGPVWILDEAPTLHLFDDVLGHFFTVVKAS